MEWFSALSWVVCALCLLLCGLGILVMLWGVLMRMCEDWSKSAYTPYTLVFADEEVRLTKTWGVCFSLLQRPCHTLGNRE